jgi:hypothetical protein
MHAYLHCHDHVQRPREVAQAAIFPGSRKRAPGVLWPQRGATQSIPIDGLPETAWSAVDRGTARADSRPKSLRSVTWFQAGHRKYLYFSVATGLRPERNIPLHLFSGRRTVS